MKSANRNALFPTDKVVIITGAGGGIGRELALAAALQGARVVVNDIGTSVHGEGSDRGPAQKVVDEILAAGGRAVANTDSVSEWQSAQHIVESAMDHFGQVDAVVNNAGILRDRMFHKMSPDEWDAVIRVHLSGGFYVARAAAPHFREQSSGAYVHMTSNSGLIGNVGQANYSAAKLGLVALSKSIALDMARFGVRSNCVAPAAWSRMIGAMPVATPEQAARSDMMRTSLAPARIAPLVTYLCSDRAGSVNGQVFYVRGNEIFLYHQMGASRSVHRSEGWTPATIADHAIPALKGSFEPVQQITDVYNWDPV
jgi:NAD(P)-dependent dehydrogenase (short-subunit alcohol dehydrogenase family)